MADFDVTRIESMVEVIMELDSVVDISIVDMLVRRAWVVVGKSRE